MDYLTLTAPFDGVITARNANTFDFVLPTTGDPTAYYLSPDISPGGTAAPIYVVDRLDIVRIFVDIPEQDANFVHIGTKATVLAKAFRDEPISGHRHAHLLGAEHEEPHAPRRDRPSATPSSQLLPGMYAYVKVIIERPDVRALPRHGTCLQRRPDLLLAVRERQGGADRGRDGRQRRRVDRGHQSPSARPPEAPSDTVPWTPIDGTEQVILGDLSVLTDGAPVEVAPATAGTKLASETPARSEPNVPCRAIPTPDIRARQGLP